MENITTTITDNIVNSFDFPFCVSVNIATYIIIKLITDYKKDKIVTTWNKRFIFLIVSIVLAVIYLFAGTDIKIIANSIILAPVSWSWLFKPICNKFNIDYSNKIN
ncbi:MAG: hypothetical protein [crAssphage sp. isolate ctcc615]|uniref:Uncharacterized protein n=1 Tax=crAssphage sp. isolate ctcc615 TaxID=2989853 RepID=A0A345BNZ2_9CAUD|nr:MAG: hypothetical protein KNU00_gp74 [crAssphage sp. isolate ctcc615]AXF52163.1 MAG: hypothetical protein [crAssphage sp. isolate ctcc615]